ncbi:MAG: B12-binding domain-containing radical SAM protein [Deltaproteobacteria bacterium]|nr:B12-binding domain-containing radical SAM protein [Deltaproteobacteria bacterium]
MATSAAVRSASRLSFGLVLTFYQRDPAYALGLAAISAHAKRVHPDVRVHLVPIFRDDDVEKIVRLVDELEPDLLGVSAMAPTWLPLDPYLRALKRARPDVPICVGGYQAIVSPEETLAHDAVDFVCVGDGEEPVAELIAYLCGRRAGAAPIAGLWEKTADGTVVRTPPWLVRDLTALPFPDYTIFERDGDVRYLSPHAVESKRLMTLPVLSGRGCPYRCSYCANTTLLDLFGGRGGLLRKHEPEPLLKELARLRARYDVEFFQFWDEEFLYDARYVRRLLGAYRDTVGVPFSMFARPDTMRDDLCSFAAAAGCHSMWVGIESGSDTYRRQFLNRRTPNAALLAAVATARRHGIKCMAFSMVGLPFETRAQAEETLALVRSLAPELAIFSQFVPLPGTPLYELCRRHDLLLPASVDHQMWPIGRLNIKEHPGGMTSAEMATMAAAIMDYLETHTRVDA